MPTALVVDDFGDIRLLMRVLLANRGFDVSEASTGAEAIAELRDGRRPDVVVLDLQMPEMDGWTTLEAIRRLDPADDIAVVICSVKAGWQDLRRAWQLGCDGYINKPFGNGDFTDEVGSVVVRSPHERRALRAQRLLDMDAT